MGSLEGWAGGTGRRDQLVSVAQDQLAIGADVDDERYVILIVGFLGDEYPDIVSPDKTGLDGHPEIS